MKKLPAILILICSHLFVSAQDDSSDIRALDKSKLFTGGSVVASFSSGTTVLGATPHFGISLNKFIDVAASLGYNYMSQRSYYTDEKLRLTTVSPGAFVRLFPVKFIYLQGLYEYHFARLKNIVPGSPSIINKDQGSSFLVGGGYSGGRDEWNNTYYYMSILWDVAKSEGYSPYKDNQNRAVPIIRAGFNIGLFQNRFRNDDY